MRNIEEEKRKKEKIEKKRNANEEKREKNDGDEDMSISSYLKIIDLFQLKVTLSILSTFVLPAK